MLAHPPIALGHAPLDFIECALDPLAVRSETSERLKYMLLHGTRSGFVEPAMIQLDGPSDVDAVLAGMLALNASQRLGGTLAGTGTALRLLGPCAYSSIRAVPA